MNRRSASLLGVLFVAILAASIVMLNPPGTSSSGAKVLSYYASHRTISEVDGLLIALSVSVGLLFYGLLRDYLRRGEAVGGLTATAFGGALLFAASGLVSTGTLWALTDSPGHLSPAAAQALYLIGEDGAYGFTVAGIALMLFAFGLAILKSDVLPRWLGWVAFPFAVVAFVPPAGFIALIGTGVWTLIASITMYRRQGATQPTAEAVPAST